MNKATARYPNDWKEIARAIKEREGWHCYKCGTLGLRPGERLFTAKDRSYIIQVHHWDCNPGNNSQENLVALCAVCHLGMHRRRGSILEGQGGLALIVERRVPPPAMRRKPLPVQLGLFGSYSRYRQLELWGLGSQRHHLEI